jgi:hypothetical protein
MREFTNNLLSLEKDLKIAVIGINKATALIKSFAKFFDDVIDSQMIQTCKVCGAQDRFNFHVSDEVWARIVPKEIQDHVVCLKCFDKYAKKRH